MDDPGPTTPTAARRPNPDQTGDDALRTAFGFDLPDDQWLDIIRESKSAFAMGRLGPYRLLAELGRGGQGSVYKAIRDGETEPVALKRLPQAGASPDAAARFEREREAIALLSHPCIVGIRGVEFIDGQSILAMEFVDGRPIDTWAGSLPDRPVEPIVNVFLKVCDAVAHAHRRGVMHRDLKPSNILVDQRGRPRVLDFGLAKLTEPPEPRTAGADAARLGVNGQARPGAPSAVDSFITRASGFVGTPAYAAPEQLAADARSIDTRCDVYALGVLLYALLCGSAPIDARAPLPELFDQIRRGISRPPSSIRPSLGRELDAITLKAAALEPARRYASIDDFAADLRRYLAGQTVLAHPPTTLYKVSKLWRRHRVIAPVLTLAALGVVVLSVVSTALALNLRTQRDRLAQVSDSESRARAAAERALEESRTQSERHQAASRFLADMLNGVHEAHMDGLPVGSREMIDHAAGQLDAGELANQPEVEVALLYAVGRAYYDLNYPIDAERFVARALDRSRAVYGPDHYETGRCLYMTGLIAEAKGRNQEALSLYGQAREIVKRAAGEDDAVSLQIDNNLACVMRSVGRVEESAALHRRTLAGRIRVRGTELHADVISSYRNLATTLARLKQFPEAHAAIDRSIELSTALFGPDNMKTVQARFYLSRVLSDEGHHEEALALRRELLPIAIAAGGEDHPMTIAVRRYIQFTCYTLGQWEEGLANAVRARESLRRTQHMATTIVPDTSLAIAEGLRRLGRLTEAREEALTGQREAAGLGAEGESSRGRAERILERIERDEAARAKSAAPATPVHAPPPGPPAEPRPTPEPDARRR
ncbi:MAG: tetratricopeptide repeat protein [Phycisphaerales bacterium]